MNTKNSLILTKRYKTILSSIHTVYRLINSTFDLKDFLLGFGRLIYQIFDAKDCQIILTDNSKKYSVIRCFINPTKKQINIHKTKIINPVERKVLETNTTICKNTIIAVPLVAEEISGILEIKRTDQEKPFDLFEKEALLTLATQAVIGIKNFRLIEEQEKILFGSIKSLVTLLDAKVPTACTHTPEFLKLVLAIGYQMHLNEKDLKSLEYASLLHDTGKIGIPLGILTKSEQLSEEEIKLIRNHPQTGAKILKSVEKLKPVIPIILHHHEKYDGTGYPSKLRKNQIPLGSRIMAVADAFDAIIHGRPYKHKIPFEEAIEEIKTNSGKQFDPEVVNAFIKVISSQKRKFKKILK
ncbi:MAG: HD-GYP domain-containing protein [Candidatus Omnitrophota bacterium]